MYTDQMFCIILGLA